MTNPFAIPLLVVCLQAAEKENFGCDRSAIQWGLPGNFAAARERARRERRLLILKGIAFGLDERGARDATSGRW